MENNNNNNSNKIITILVCVLTLLLIITTSITIWAVFFRDTTPVLAPDYAPQDTDPNAEELDDKDDQKLEQDQGGGAVSLSFTKEVVVDLNTKTALISFRNPTRSNQNMLLQIAVRGTVIAQSGLLKPGYGLSTLKLFDKAELMAGTYDGEYIVYYYQDDTGEKAVLNTKIPIKITVK